MKREDFMTQLESLLANIPSAEREEALQYYNDYFDDAGVENEQEVIEALGNPAKVAENIKRDLNADAGSAAGAYRTATVNHEVTEYRQAPEEKSKTSMPTWLIVLLVILGVFASPAILGVAAGVIGVLVGILCTWFAIIFAFGVVAIALFGCLIALIVAGCGCLILSPLTGLALLGAGLLCGGIGMLFLMLTVAMAGIATPAIVKGIIYIFKKIKGE